MSTNIIKKVKRNNFTQIANDTLMDKSLSIRAKGMLCLLLSFPDDWVINSSHIASLSTDGKTSTRSAMKELEKQGYLEYKTKHKKDGTLDGKIWIVYESIDLNPNVRSTESQLPRQSVRVNIGEVDTTNTKRDNNTKNTNTEDANIKLIIDYLNHKTGKTFRSASKLLARFKEGFTVDDAKRVIDNKCSQWLNDDKMKGYLRPDTLFSEKFDGYLNEEVSKTEADKATDFVNEFFRGR